MTKINYLRKKWAEKYSEKDLKSAAEIGEVLLREHWHNKNMRSESYANDLFNLACVHEEMGNLERAAELYSDSARMIFAAKGETLPYAERINNLALVLARLEMTDSAFLMFGNVAAIRRKKLGPNHPLYADALYNFANAAADVGRNKDAARYHKEALKIRENEGHTQDIINSLHSLAFLYESTGDRETAISYAERAMNHSVADDRAYASACNYLAGLYESEKKYDDALSLFDQVLSVASGAVGREHSVYLNTALRKANLLAIMNRPIEALSAHEEICSTFQRISGTKHIFYANCLRGMAMLHKTLENHSRAEELILEAMKIRRTMYEDITLDITFLIRLHLQQDRPDKALEALIYALMCSGQESPEFTEMLDNLVEVFSQTKTPTTIDFISSMELLNDKEKLRPILNKWEEWERGFGR